MYNLILPLKLYSKLNSLPLTRIQKNHAFRFIKHLFYENQRSSEELFGNNFISFSSIYLREEFTRDYYKMFMRSLLENDIIRRRPYFNSSFSSNFKGGTMPENSQTFGYKINESLFDFSDIKIVQFQNKTYKHGNKQIKQVVNDLERLDIDTDGMIKAVMNLDISDEIFINSDIKDDIVDLVDTHNKTKDGKPIIRAMEIGKALAIAIERGTDLIWYKHKCYLDNLDDFKRKRLNNIRAKSIYSIMALWNKDFYAAQNLTNNRLDTNLTSLKSTLLKEFITYKGMPITDIDMKNCQPCLLAHLIANLDRVIQDFYPLMVKYNYPEVDSSAPDILLFQELAAKGQVYDYIGEQLGWSREYAKDNFIKIMFSRPKFRSVYKNQIKGLFPSIIDFMDEFKTMNGDHTQLSILLQKIEVELFIERIYKPLRKQGYYIFTKHDSILCFGEKDVIKEKMETILQSTGLKFTLK